MWHRIADIKLLVTVAVALLVVAALACGAKEAAAPAKPQAAKAALPAVTAPTSDADTAVAPGAPKAPAQPSAAGAPAKPAAPDAPTAATGVTSAQLAPSAGKAASDADAAAPAAAAAAPQAASAGAAASGPAVRTAAVTRAASDISPTGTKKGYVPAPQVPGEVFMPSLYAGPTPTTWQENPRFTAAIASGEAWDVSTGHYGNHTGPLEALDDRVPVPADRLIFDVPDAIGEYGGIWRMANSGWVIDMATMNVMGIMKWGADGVTMTPYGVKEAGLSADGKVATFKLREGMKWSDNTPVSIDNVRFAHESLMFNSEFRSSPRYPCQDLVTGNWCTFNVVDDSTWTYTYDTPNYILLEGENASRTHFHQCRGGCVAASDFVRQFVPGFADPATLAAMMAEADIDNWVSHFMTRVSVHGPFYRLQPQVGPWIQTAGVSVGAFMHSESNPFYHVFDPAGNQMPYVDGSSSIGYESREVAVFRAMAGESDGHTQIYQTAELPLYQQNMVSGDFSIYAWPDQAGSDSWFRTNQTYNDDPDIGTAMRTKDFRVALSLAMDREEVNELVFLSLGTPGNMIPNPVTPYAPDEATYRNMDATRDISRANALLNSLGYRDTDGDGTRNFPSGSNIDLSLEISSERWYSLGDILVSNFADIGIGLEWTPDENAGRHWGDNVNYLGVGGGHGNPNPFHSYPAGTVHGPGMVAPLIDLNLRTEGAEGMGQTGPDSAYLPLAPAGTWPADSAGVLKQLGEAISAGQSYELMHPTRVAAGKSYFALGAENKYNIGLVHFAPAYRGIMLKRNNFRNVQKHHNWDAIGFFMDLTYFEDGRDNMNNPGNKSQKYKSESFLTGLTYD